jgi:hypothetical protein
VGGRVQNPETLTPTKNPRSRQLNPSTAAAPNSRRFLSNSARMLFHRACILHSCVSQTALRRLPAAHSFSSKPEEFRHRVHRGHREFLRGKFLLFPLRDFSRFSWPHLLALPAHHFAFRPPHFPDSSFCILHFLHDPPPTAFCPLIRSAFPW